MREWLIQNEFMGKEGQNIPEMSDEWVETISNKYIELYEQLTGHKFEPMQLEHEEVYGKIVEALNAMGLHTR